jgi:hypothetical protein
MSQFSVFDVMHGQAVHNGQTQSVGKAEKAARADRCMANKGEAFRRDGRHWRYCRYWRHCCGSPGRLAPPLGIEDGDEDEGEDVEMLIFWVGWRNLLWNYRDRKATDGGSTAIR